MANFLSVTVNVLISKIIEYGDRTTKKALSMVDRRTNAVMSSMVRCIRIFPPKCFSLRERPLNMPKDVLVKVIRRFPNLGRIIFEPENNYNSFGAEEMPYLESLISYLENNPEKHPLNFIKKIQLREITVDEFGRAKELNSRFLGSIGHEELEDLRIAAYHLGSALSGVEIQPALKNSPNLKTFVFNGFQTGQTVDLSFESQHQLTKVKLLHWKGSASTIESLRNCKALEELVIHCAEFSPEEIKAALLEDHPWNLKRLELKGIILKNDAELDVITQKLPNLERLSVELESISAEGMEQLGRNCPKLKVTVQIPLLRRGI